MHILEYSCSIQSYFQSSFQRQVDQHFFHVQQSEQTALRNMLENNHYVWDFGHHTHKQSNVWMPQNWLHHYFVLNFSKQIVSNRWIEYFFYGHRCSVKRAFMDHWETSLPNLLTKLQIIQRNLSHTRNWRQSTCSNWNFTCIRGELLETLLM